MSFVLEICHKNDGKKLYCSNSQAWGFPYIPSRVGNGACDHGYNTVPCLPTLFRDNLRHLLR
jgi:hypothetical protein